MDKDHTTKPESNFWHEMKNSLLKAIHMQCGLQLHTINRRPTSKNRRENNIPRLYNIRLSRNLPK